MSERDARPAVGTPGEPAPWRRAGEPSEVEIAQGEFRDGTWSYLFGSDTG